MDKRLKRRKKFLHDNRIKPNKVEKKPIKVEKKPVKIEKRQKGENKPKVETTQTTPSGKQLVRSNRTKPDTFRELDKKINKVIRKTNKLLRDNDFADIADKTQSNASIRFKVRRAMEDGYELEDAVLRVKYGNKTKDIVTNMFDNELAQPRRVTKTENVGGDVIARALLDVDHVNKENQKLRKKNESLASFTRTEDNQDINYTFQKVMDYTQDKSDLRNIVVENAEDRAFSLGARFTSNMIKSFDAPNVIGSDIADMVTNMVMDMDQSELALRLDYISKHNKDLRNVFYVFGSDEDKIVNNVEDFIQYVLGYDLDSEYKGRKIKDVIKQYIFEGR